MQEASSSSSNDPSEKCKDSQREGLDPRVPLFWVSCIKQKPLDSDVRNLRCVPKQEPRKSVRFDLEGDDVQQSIAGERTESVANSVEDDTDNVGCLEWLEVVLEDQEICLPCKARRLEQCAFRCRSAKAIQVWKDKNFRESFWDNRTVEAQKALVLACSVVLQSATRQLQGQSKSIYSNQRIPYMSREMP